MALIAPSIVRPTFAILCALHCTQNIALAGGTADLELQPRLLADDVWFVEGAPEVASASNQGFISNAGLVRTKAGTLAVDALGTPALGAALMRVSRQVCGAKVTRVVLTHYHSDHFYGAQPMQESGADVWARKEGKTYLASDVAGARLAQRRETLWPWVDENTQLTVADRWLDLQPGEPWRFEFGGRPFALISGGASHAPDDMMLLVEDVGVLFAGDLYFTGRLPFVVDSNTREWLKALDTIEALKPKVVVAGHGPASTDVSTDIAITRRYIVYLREKLREAAADLMSFEEAYDSIDWSSFAEMPTFDEANRLNAFSVFLEVQKELLEE